MEQYFSMTKIEVDAQENITTIYLHGDTKLW